MRHRRPDLIVPIRDRRQHRRFLTLRNTAFAMLALIVAFIAITIRSEMRRGPAEGDYGRLYRRELPPPQIEPRPVEIVQEAKPIDDSISADPMLTAAAARGQWLEGETVPLTTTRTVRDGKSRVGIVGGPEGVIAIDNAARREGRKLKGGIFRSE